MTSSLSPLSTSTNLQKIPKRLILAPMEGVIDFEVRKLLTLLNPFDYCVTEFIRITSQPVSKKALYRLAPELLTEGKTASKTPVRVQFLGQDPIMMAHSARLAIEAGSFGVDVNCGCPAKTVVGHQGGAFLLQYPEKIYQLTKAIRAEIGDHLPLSVKIRLGFEDKSHCFEIAEAIESAGATELVIHGRTKEEGYQADKIDWLTIGKISKHCQIPIIANGEIFSVEDSQKCMIQAQTDQIMLGRGILSSPNLGAQIKTHCASLDWETVLHYLIEYAKTEHAEQKPFYASARIKQWLSYLKKTYPKAQETLFIVRTAKTQSEMLLALTESMQFI